MTTKQSERQNQITRLVERGYETLVELHLLDRQFNFIEKQLKEVAIEQRAERLPMPELDGEGTQLVALGAGCQCRIAFPADIIKTQFDPQRGDFASIRLLAGEHFKSLFHKITLYQPTNPKTFRKQVTKLLAPRDAAQLLELSTSAVEPQTFWKLHQAGKEQS
jgi:hypothetical protein